VADGLTAPLPAGKRAGDFVHTGAGFILCAALLVLTAAVNAVGWWRLRPRVVPSGETTELNPTLVE
jgi:hypothetical protein